MKTFFDYDKVECVEIEEAKKEYLELEWKYIENRFVWGMGSNPEVNVMTLADLNMCVLLENEELSYKVFDYQEIKHCSVCRKVLLPDEEAYTDEKTGDILCDRHSAFNEATDNYYKKIF